jgi:polysaccharide export outer membrane protein
MLMWVIGLLALAPTSAFAQETSYTLGPEDVIVVNVVDVPKFSGEYIVPASGVISMPVVGSVNVNGMTLEQLRAHAVEKLKTRLMKPEVIVTLKVPRPRRVYVYGDVRTPGVLDLRPGWRLSEALSAAGGLQAGVQEQDVRVVLERANGTDRVEMTMAEALNGPDKDKLTLAPGDVLRITSIAMMPIYVSGKVSAPGLYRLRETEANVLAAISQAGGVTPDANITSVRIIRLNGSEETVDLAPALLRGEAVKLPKLGSGDMVLVAESQTRIAVLGYVAKPGFYSIPSGQTYTLVDAIARAEGPDKRARTSKIGVIRMENGKESRKIYDLGRFQDKADMTQNPVLQSGDVVYVPETNKVDLSQVLSGLSSIAILFDRLRR